MKKMMIIIIAIANSSLFLNGMEIQKLVRKKTVESKSKESTPRLLTSSVEINDQANVGSNNSKPLVRKKTVESKSKDTPRSLNASTEIPINGKPSIRSLDDLPRLQESKEEYRNTSKLNKSSELLKNQTK